MISTPVENIVADILIDYGNKIKSGNSHISIEEATNILSNVAHIELSKEEACDFIHLNRSRFDDLVREGKLPRGRKVKHKHSLVWYKDELMIANVNT